MDYFGRRWKKKHMYRWQTVGRVSCFMFSSSPGIDDIKKTTLSLWPPLLIEYGRTRVVSILACLCSTQECYFGIGLWSENSESISIRTSRFIIHAEYSDWRWSSKSIIYFRLNELRSGLELQRSKREMVESFLIEKNKWSISRSRTSRVKITLGLMRFVGWTEEGYCKWSIGLYGWDKRDQSNFQRKTMFIVRTSKWRNNWKVLQVSQICN